MFDFFGLQLKRERLALEKEKFVLEKKIFQLEDRLSDRDKQTQLNKKIQELEAQLAIEKAKTAEITAKAKSEYAEHAMAINDERLKEIKSAYESFSQRLIDGIKAAQSAPANVQNIMK